MSSLEQELERARELSVTDLAAAIESIGFECTRCGACCRAGICGDGSGDQDQQPDEGVDHPTTEDHTATVYPDEIRQIQGQEDYDWRDVARPVPYGLENGTGETFEWALQTDACGDCVFYEDGGDGGTPGGCGIYDDRPLVCRTYPFSVDLGGTSQPLGAAVEREGVLRAHECEGLGRDIDAEAARELAATLKERAIRDLEEAVAVRDNYEPSGVDDGVTVFDSEGPKRVDGSPRESNGR